jgi:flagellin
MILGIRNDGLTPDPLHYLAVNHNALARSLERLASGSKLTRAADGPASLILSEQLRAQLASVEQALENTALSLSIVQTADDAINVATRLLMGLRQTALAAANTDPYDLATVAGFQSELKTALDGIDRLSRNTQFGRKNLLDGSQGSVGTSNNSELVFIRSGAETLSSPVNGYSVEVTRLPRRAVFEGSMDDDDASGLTIVLEEEDGRAVTVHANPLSSAEGLYTRLAQAVLDANMNLAITHDDEDIRIEHKDYGLAKGFMITTSKDGVLTSSANEPELYFGTDIAGSINEEPAMGNGAYLTGKASNEFTSGLQVAYLGSSTGNVGSITVRQNAPRFQIGTEAGQQMPITLANIHSSALGRGVPNNSGFNSLADINFDSPQSAADAVRMVDGATEQLLSVRGYLGSVQRSLDHHDSVLRLTQESVGSAESIVRDVDLAKELADFTRRQIVTEASMALLAHSHRIRENALRVLLDVQAASIPVRHVHSLM